MGGLIGMTGRDRVRAALARRGTPDLPIDLGSTRSTGINAVAYSALRDYLK